MTQTVSFDCPSCLEEASLIVDAFIVSPRGREALRFSVHQWDRHGCHMFAQAAKGRREFGRQDAVGNMLRTVVNLAIMREHRLAAA